MNTIRCEMFSCSVVRLLKFALKFACMLHTQLHYTAASLPPDVKMRSMPPSPHNTSNDANTSLDTSNARWKVTDNPHRRAHFTKREVCPTSTSPSRVNAPITTPMGSGG